MWLIFYKQILHSHLSSRALKYLCVGGNPIGRFAVIITFLDPFPEPFTLNWIMPILTTTKAVKHKNIYIQYILDWLPVINSNKENFFFQLESYRKIFIKLVFGVTKKVLELDFKQGNNFRHEISVRTNNITLNDIAL